MRLCSKFQIDFFIMKKGGGFMATSTTKRKQIRAAEHARDVLIERLAKTRTDLQAARLKLKQAREK